MKKFFSVIKFISAGLFVFSLAILLCLEPGKDTSISEILFIYSSLLMMLFVGGLGMCISENPNYYLGMVYGFFYSIVKNILAVFGRKARDYRFVSRYSLVDRYYILYYEGVDKYDAKHSRC